MKNKENGDGKEDGQRKSIHTHMYIVYFNRVLFGRIKDEGRENWREIGNERRLDVRFSIAEYYYAIRYIRAYKR